MYNTIRIVQWLVASTLTLCHCTASAGDGAESIGTRSNTPPLVLASLAGNVELSAGLQDEPLMATTNTWLVPSSSDDWFDPLNWSLTEPPLTGQTVIIPTGASLRLTNAPSALEHVEIANGAQLSFEGWGSVLQAKEIVVAGTITHAAQTVMEPDPVTGEWIPQHRIWLQGSNLTVTSTGKLNADYVGYQPGAGPGCSIDNLQGGGGGGYGGHGGVGYKGTAPGPANGIASDPWQPGSGGGAYSTSGPAGGAIRVDLDGSLVIDGVVSACGQNGVYLRGTSGSGGGIFMQCRTVQGAGIVRADGGVAQGYSGSGGGGRIAMNYDSMAQAALPMPRPPLRFSAWSRYASSELSLWPEMGTLYLPDTTLLAASSEADAVLDKQRFWHVRLVIGTHPTSWHPASLTITNCVIGFVEGFELHIGGDLQMQGITGVSTPLSGTLQAGLRLFAAASKQVYGARLTVGRDWTIGSDAWFYPRTSGTNGAIVGVSVGRDVRIAAGGGINAEQGGYLPQVDNLNGPGAGLNNDSGGSYGGHGGGGSYRPTYGLAALPLAPGSPGGWRDAGYGYTPSGSGGGAIHVLAGRNMVVDGWLRANGTSGNTYRGTGGSGGAIFLAAGRRFSGAGALQADGGTTDLQRAPGGGGRIAVWHHIPLDNVAQRIATRNVGTLQYQETIANFTGTLSVDVAASIISGFSQPERGTKGFYREAYTLLLLR